MLRSCALVTAFAAVALSAHAATLNVAAWNVANRPNDAAEQQQLRTILGYAGPLDLLTMAETDASSAVDTAAIFGQVFGGTFASVVAPADGGGDRTGVVYDTGSFSLVGTSTVGVGTLTHPALRTQLRPLGTDGRDDVYVYATHLTSGSTSSTRNKRLTEAGVIRNDVAALGVGARAVVAGDFNWQRADEVSAGVGAYRTFAAAGTGQVVDPLNRVGDWHGNAAFRDLFTNDPGSNLDDRFDMQLASPSLLDGRGLDYVAGSYRVLGNNGTIAVGGTVYANASLPAGVAAAFDTFSDHLPVLAGYRYDVTGDADADDDVDFDDFVRLQTNFGRATSGYAQGDFDLDGDTDFDDFVLLQTNFGLRVGGGPAASREQYAAVTSITDASQVPEPASVTMLGLSVLVLLRRGRSWRGGLRSQVVPCAGSSRR